MTKLAVSILALIAGACASAPPPTDRMASAEASMRAASELGADQVPAAQLHVTLANEELSKAKALIQQDENEHAATMAMRAAADAELALALTRETQTQAAAQKTLNEPHALEPSAPTP